MWSGVAFFLVGLVMALLWGWFYYPNVMYDEQEQPIAFNHQVHIEMAGMACADCHFLREDGTFNGRPTTESCAACHAFPMTEHPEELKFVAEYADTGREIADEWLITTRQPDNVFFPHAAHSFENCARCHEDMTTFPLTSEEQLCNACHIDMANMTEPPVYKENWLSTYPNNIMMMWECESCHANSGHRFGQANASNACFVCHK